MPIADPARRRAYHRAWHARRLAGLALLGLCEACGVRDRDGNTVRCRKCRVRRAKLQRLRKARKAA